MKDETQHLVMISTAFFLGVAPVTQEQWRDVMGDRPSFFFRNDVDSLPVESVSWYDAIDFCNRLSEEEGLSCCYSGEGNAITWNKDCDGYRLPTEAEWEYAARAGTTTAIYAGRLTIRGEFNGPELDPIAWYGGNSGVRWDNGFGCSTWKERQDPSATYCGPHTVGQKKKNVWGLYDMLGNVSEWVWDRRGDYPGEAVTDPTGPATGPMRVYRGCSWASSPQYCRAAFRNNADPNSSGFALGFRVARSLPQH